MINFFMRCFLTMDVDEYLDEHANPLGAVQIIWLRNVDVSLLSGLSALFFDKVFPLLSD